MRALVVYESHFGNTMDVAHAVLSGLRQRFDAEILEVVSAPRDVAVGFDLLVLGAPTHAFGLSRPETRSDAVKQGAEAAADEIGMREWLNDLDALPSSCRVAVFGTTVVKPRLVASLGTAAGALERRLRRMGLQVILPAEQFWVEGVKGPLVEGEEARAREWGASLALAAMSARPSVGREAGAARSVASRVPPSA